MVFRMGTHQFRLGGDRPPSPDLKCQRTQFSQLSLGSDRTIKSRTIVDPGWRRKNGLPSQFESARWAALPLKTGCNRKALYSSVRRKIIDDTALSI